MVLPTVISQPGTSLRSLVGAFVLTKLTEGKSPRTIEFYAENLRRFIWYAENHNWPQDILGITQWHIKAFLGYVAMCYIQHSQISLGGLKNNQLFSATKS